MARTKTNTLNGTKHGEQQAVTNIKKTNYFILVFIGFFYFLCFIFINMIKHFKWELVGLSLTVEYL